MVGLVAAGQSQGLVLCCGAWGGDAQPCVPFPTGIAVRHRRCQLQGMTYFSLHPGMDPSPSPGTSPIGSLAGRGLCVSVTARCPSLGHQSGLVLQ